jgi:hypothetical protein
MYNFLNSDPPAFRKNFFLKNGREGISGTIDFLSTIDQLRHTSSQTVFKELYQIYDSN